MTDDPPHIIEAVPVDEAGLTWIRCSDESTAEISALHSGRLKPCLRFGVAREFSVGRTDQFGDENLHQRQPGRCTRLAEVL